VNIDDAVSGGLLRLTQNQLTTDIGSYDGTSAVLKSGLTSMLNTARKRALSWSGSARAITGDGAAVAAGPFDGSFGNLTDNIIAIMLTTAPWYGTVRNVKIYPTALSDAQLIAITTP